MSNVGHTIDVSAIVTTGVPQPYAVFNEFDSYGTLLGLPRLRGEKNTDYKKRLLDVFTRRASATYTGLLNGITRELGLEFYKPINIQRDPLIGDSLLPVIRFVDNKVKIWVDKEVGDPIIEINRSNISENAYWVDDLVDRINESGLFVAEINEGIEPKSRADCIVNQASSRLVGNEGLRSSPLQTLANKRIEPSSLVFTDTRTFSKEVSTEIEVTKVGRYYVDYTNGVIKSFGVPSEGSRIRYIYHADSFDPVASPVIIRSLQSDDFKEQMFIQTTSPTGEQNSGIPTEFGANIINELMSVFPTYWGD